MVEMEQRRAVFAAVEADTDLLRGILIQGGLDGLQRRLHFLTQQSACGTKACTPSASSMLEVVQLCSLVMQHFSAKTC